MYMKEDSKTIFTRAEDDSHFLTVISMKENSRKEKDKDRGFWDMQMEVHMREDGKKTENQGKECSKPIREWQKLHM